MVNMEFFFFFFFNVFFLALILKHNFLPLNLYVDHVFEIGPKGLQ